MIASHDHYFSRLEEFSTYTVITRDNTNVSHQLRRDATEVRVAA